MSTPNSNLHWTELLDKAVTEPGIMSQAFSRFHNYSLGNQLLAMLQCSARGIQLGPIGTFMHWKDLGRFVKKGEKAIQLCMPVSGKRTADKHNEETGMDESIEVGYTRFVYRNNWFALAQTEGDAYTPEPTPGWEVKRALTSLDIQQIECTHINGNVQGYAHKRTIALNPVADQPIRTLLHELAHVVLGHTMEAVMNDAGERTPRDIRELEAESTAMLVAASLGMPGVEESRAYIQAWFKGSTIPERNAQRIFSAADKILKAGQEIA